MDMKLNVHKTLQVMVENNMSKKHFDIIFTAIDRLSSAKQVETIGTVSEPYTEAVPEPEPEEEALDPDPNEVVDNLAKEIEKEYYDEVNLNPPKAHSHPYHMAYWLASLQFHEDNFDLSYGASGVGKFEECKEKIKNLSPERFAEIGGIFRLKKPQLESKVQLMRENFFENHVNSDFEVEFTPTREMCWEFCKNGRPADILPEIPYPDMHKVGFFYLKWRDLVEKEFPNYKGFTDLMTFVNRFKQMKKDRSWQWIYTEKMMEWFLAFNVDDLETEDQLSGYLELLMYANNYTLGCIAQGMDYEISYNVKGSKDLDTIETSHMNNVGERLRKSRETKKTNKVAQLKGL